jgi:uncharacterized protein (TIGR01777 family)
MKILITGGSGLVGKKLSFRLNELGHEVCILTRKKRGLNSVKEYLWTDSFIEAGALDNVDAVVHLAGESIAGGRWTKRRKKKIIESRTETLRLIAENIPSCPILIGASGTGFYGGDRGEETLTEESSLGEGFLAQCCELWENEEMAFAEKHGSRLVIIRTGLVLSENGGALPKMAAPFKYGLGSNLGSGEQWVSWIHADDLVNLYITALTDSSVSGIINGVSNSPIRHTAFNKVLAKVLNKSIFLPAIPKFLVKAALGEMSVLLLGSVKAVSNRNLEMKFPTLDLALNDIYKG